MSTRTIETPIGPLTLQADEAAVTAIRFGADGAQDVSPLLDAAEAQLREYFAGARRRQTECQPRRRHGQPPQPDPDRHPLPPRHRRERHTHRLCRRAGDQAKAAGARGDHHFKISDIWKNDRRQDSLLCPASSPVFYLCRFFFTSAIGLLWLAYRTSGFRHTKNRYIVHQTYIYKKQQASPCMPCGGACCIVLRARGHTVRRR